MKAAMWRGECRWVCLWPWKVYRFGHSRPAGCCERFKSALSLHQLSNRTGTVSFQLKLQPKVNYAQTVAKAREITTNSRVEASQQFQTIPGVGKGRLQKLVQNMSEQLTALQTQQSKPIHCFKCGKSGYVAQAIPTMANSFQQPSFDMPKNVHPDFHHVIINHKQLHLGSIKVSNHPCVGSPMS